ncbi:MAG: NnrU family protein [Burkholderiales bacterium]|nr:protein NrnU [Burkholderiales bacterium]MDE1926100.1 NnrU family protein [Burkholderiales bacterium]MDE2504757.1 NnrU family protein [Burkholderiales bacterium]
MTDLILGLLVFLGAHSVRIVAEPWRRATIARIGAARWKLAYAAVSLVGFALIVWGYGSARAAPVLLWSAPIWARHVAALLTLAAFVLLAAAYVPGNAIRSRLHHPMLLGVQIWALAHLIANGRLAAELLFASFGLWAWFGYRAARRRDAVEARVGPSGRTGATMATVLVGVVAWAVFAFWAHGLLIGVRPFG